MKKNDEGKKDVKVDDGDQQAPTSQDAVSGDSADLSPSRTGSNGKQAGATKVERPYPRESLQEALRVPTVLKDMNGGKPWASEDVAKALGYSKNNNKFFYLGAASRDYGLTVGGRDSKEVALTELGHQLMYAGTPAEEERLKRQAFLNVPVFKSVLEHYGGSNLPEMQYLSNTLQREFKLHPDIHEEFSELFRKNCEFLKIGARFGNQEARSADTTLSPAQPSASGNVVIIAEAEHSTSLKCFVAMPFSEKTGQYRAGYFEEVLNSLIGPAGRKAGFNMFTAKRQGTDVIQSTIINQLIEADLVLVDLTEHNPNVLLELGIRLAKDKPVVLIRAEGTGRIFDVDNMLRVYDYSPNLWPSTLQHDVPKLSEHIKATWDQRDTSKSYMQILLASAGSM